MKRKCTKCLKTKAISQFHKDSKGREGYAARCKTCKNASKSQPSNAPRSVAKSEKVKVLVEEEKTPHRGSKCDLEIFTALFNRFDSHFVLSLSRKGARLQHHGQEKTETWKAGTVEDLMAKVLTF